MVGKALVSFSDPHIQPSSILTPLHYSAHNYSAFIILTPIILTSPPHYSAQNYSAYIILTTIVLTYPHIILSKIILPSSF